MTRLFTSSVSSIDIRKAVRAHGKSHFEVPSVRFRAPWGEFTVRLEHVAQSLGGERVYFACPLCGRRSDLLYFARKRVGCRRCQRLHYWSQALAARHRRTYGLIKQRERLGQPPGLGLVADFPEKPKWMRARTYERLAREAASREQAHLAAPFGRRITKLVAKLGS